MVASDYHRVESLPRLTGTIGVLWSLLGGPERGSINHACLTKFHPAMGEGRGRGRGREKGKSLWDFNVIDGGGGEER